MKKRKLGRTGIDVSEISFGGVEIGMPYGIGVKGAQDMLTDDQAVELLRAALEEGINFYDTARAYGKSEHLIGRAFRDNRDKVVIATKCSHFTSPNGGLPEENLLKDQILRSFHESLDALQTDYIDIFMIHNANPQILNNPAVVDTFSELKENGRVHALGVSTYTIDETRMAVDKKIWDVIQLPFNLMDQRQKSLFSYAGQNGVAIVIRSVLLKGILTDRGRNLHAELRSIERHCEQYTRIPGLNSDSLSSLATKFVLSFPEVSSVLIGIDRMQYLRQALKTVDGNYFPPDIRDQLERLSYPDPDFINLPLWEKKGWLT